MSDDGLEEYPNTTLGQVLGANGYIRGPFGSSLKRGELLSQGIPVYEQQHAIEGTRDFRYFVSEEKAEELRRFKTRVDDLIISCSGTVGRISVIAPNDPNGIISQALLALRPDVSKINSKFLYYFLCSEQGRNSITDISSGSVQVNIARRAIVESIKLPLPPLSSQEKIVAVLQELDDKIELNRRMNETLEAMARALFQSWFVDFDPVRVKARGGDPVAELGLAPEVAALFPDSFVDSELGEIPKGWTAEPIDKLGDFLNGLPMQKHPVSETEPYLPVIKIAELRRGITSATDRASANIPSAYRVENGDLLFSWSGSLTAKIWVEGSGALNQHLFKVSSSRHPQWLLLQWIEHHLPYLQRIAAAKATTMGHIQRIHLTQSLCSTPPQYVVDTLNPIFEPIHRATIENGIENSKLAETRDFLLPKLLSGEITPGEASA